MVGGGKLLACGSAGIAGVVGRRGLGMAAPAGVVVGDCQAIAREASSRCAGRAGPIGFVCNVCNLKSIAINRGHRQSVCRALVFIAPVVALLPCAEHRIGRSA